MTGVQTCALPILIVTAVVSMVFGVMLIELDVAAGHGPLRTFLKAAFNVARNPLPVSIGLGIVASIVAAGIPVIGHVGLRPQAVHQLGGYRMQRDLDRLMADARAAADAGAFAVLMECIPEAAARAITAALDVPTFGIGAGGGCDGQVLVFHDLVGLSLDRVPKFARAYTDAKGAMAAAPCSRNTARRASVSSRWTPRTRTLAASVSGVGWWFIGWGDLSGNKDHPVQRNPHRVFGPTARGNCPRARRACLPPGSAHVRRPFFDWFAPNRSWKTAACRPRSSVL